MTIGSPEIQIFHNYMQSVTDLSPLFCRKVILSTIVQLAHQSTVHTDLDAGKLYSCIRHVSLQLISLMFSDHNRAKRVVKELRQTLKRSYQALPFILHFIDLNNLSIIKLSTCSCHHSIKVSYQKTLQVGHMILNF